MANPTTRITISANDQASPVIRRIGMEMAGLGQTVDSVGKMGSLTGFGAGLMALANPITVLAAGIAGLASVTLRLDEAMRLEGLQRAYTAIYGSAGLAGQQMQWLYDISAKLGLQFQSTAESAKGFFAAGQGTPLEGDMNRIFASFSQAGAVLGLTKDRMNNVFIALGQMISKGKVQTEELRRQIGEHLPGAFQLAAKAMGVTTGELDKMLEDGKVLAEDMLPKMATVLASRYPGAASESAKAVNSLSTEWERFKASASATETIVSGINAVTGALKGMSDAMSANEKRYSVIAQMSKAGITQQIIGVGQTGYTQEQIDTFEWRRNAGNRQRDAAFPDFVSASDRMDAAVGAARQATNAFLKQSDASKIKKITEEAADAIKKLEAARREDADNAADYTARIKAVEEERARQIKQVTKDNESAASTIATVREKITASLAKMNDTGTEGEGRIAALTKEYNEFAKRLGAADSQVRGFADTLAYANEHLGYTPAEVARATRAVEEQSDALRDRAMAMQAATRSDGTVDQQLFSMLTALSAAQRQYTKDVESGADKSESAAKRDLAMSAARADARQQDLAVVESFYSSLAGLYTNDETLQRRLLDKQVENYRAAGVAEIDLARWKSRRELEIATDAWSGISRGLTNFYEESTNAARQWESFTTSTFGGIASAFQVTTDGMTVNWNNMLNNMLTSLLQMRINAAAGAAAGWLESAISGAFSASSVSAGRTASTIAFSGVRHSGGPVDGPGPVRAVPMALFAGAQRYHDGGTVLSPGEVPIIARRGEHVLTPEQMAAAGNRSLNLKIEVVPPPGQPLKVARQETRMDGETTVAKLFLSALANNNSGLTDTLQNMGG